MNSPRDLLKGLLEYVEEQAREIDPRGYRLSVAKGFVRRHTELVGLPGLEFDLRPEGDHIWLHLARLEARHPPVIPELFKGLFNVSNGPFGAPPSLEEGHLTTWIAKCESKPEFQIATHDIKLRQRAVEAESSGSLPRILAPMESLG